KELYSKEQALLANTKPAVPEIIVNENPIATIDVEGYGTMTFELFANDAPQSVYNFIELANTGFYDGLIFHRIVKDFVVQGGDPEGTGVGGPGYSIKGEFTSNGIANPNKHDIGTLAMARSQENDSAGSQFYIVSGEQGKSLSADYAAFGKIITGQEVLDALNNAHLEGETPAPVIKMNSIKIDTKGTTFPSPNKLQ
ncbi:MAG: peptidylprolyl isomerase, partial [Mycoplasmatales bacterium]